jgi:hypothetical protein
MNKRQNIRIVFVAIATGLLGLASASSHAGRSVRSDSSDGAFEFLGGFWGSDLEQFGGPGLDAGRTDFRLKISPGGDPRFFNVCMGEGFVKLISTNLTCSNADFARPPGGNYIAVFATDLDDSSGRWIRTRGFVDSNSPYRLWQAVPAMRFWWNGVVLASDGTFSATDFQIVLIDRSKGTNNGDFDIEMNYGIGGDVVPPAPDADGFQGFKLGSTTRGPVFGPFGPFDTNSAPIRYCFRGGSLRATCN